MAMFTRSGLTQALIFLIAAVNAFGQSFYGSVVGTVTDATGSAVPQAAVTIINLGTADRRIAETDDNGTYQFLNLVPGNYRVEVTRPGFRRFAREPMTVEVQSAVRIDVAMQLGDVTQIVEVTAQTPLAANRKRVARPGRRIPKSAGDAAERTQCLRSGRAGSRRRARRSVGHHSHRNESVCLGQLSRSAADSQTRAPPIIDGAPINASTST